MRLLTLILLAGFSASVGAQFGSFGSSFERTRPNQIGDEEEQRWQELETELPRFPRMDGLVEFYVSAVATNAYLIDPETLSVGADGVVRYVLVVRTRGGSTNVSLEGIHCKQQQWKHYAAGHVGDGTWTRARAGRSDWRPIENKPVNRHHAALSRDLFCPMGSPIASADEGRNALRAGRHPNAN